MGVQNYRDLRVWQAGMDLVEAIYRLSQAFPTDERFGLTSQIRRAAVSVPSNIAEGHAREHTAEYVYHLSIAQGSLAEVQTQSEIARRLGYLSAEQAEVIEQQTVTLSKQLYALRNALQKKG
ncbi:four helix bundle protein [Candidatus Chloroploca mongolica]|uniref:four helix bundle protein n=1 Tax=Candidatus Chloroploca mongolica TaxID=2528176 RepID=UPI003531261B